MLNMSLSKKLTNSAFLAFVIAIFLLPFSSAGLVEVAINNSDDLLVSEDDIVFHEGKDLNLYLRLKGDLRNSGNDNYVETITLNVHFVDDDDRRDSIIGYPEYQKLCDTCEDPGYDEYRAIFRGDDSRFKAYDGNINFDIKMKNSNGSVVWDDVLVISLEAQKTGSGDSDGFTIPELPPAIQDNLILIVVGLLVVILLSVGIYTFVLAPEDTTADLYKPVKSIDPLKKSLTGVGYKSDLPGESKLNRLEDSKNDDEEEEDDDEAEYEDYDDEEDDTEFDERKILDELTGNHSIRSNDEESDEGDDDDDTPKAAPVKKKAVKKRVAKKSVAKKIKKRPSTKTVSKEPEVNMGKGIKSITCPSCSKVHNMDENTAKFICSCGRRIRI